MTTVNALTRSKTASQALKSNDLRDVNPASISPLVPVAGIYLYCRRQTLQRPPPLPLHGRPIPLRSRVWHVMAPPSGLVENRCTSRTTQASPPFCSLLFCSSLIAHCSLPTGWSVYCCFICIGCMHRALILVTHSHLNHRPALLLFLIDCDLAVAAISSCSAIYCHPLGFPQQALVIEPESSLYAPRLVAKHPSSREVTQSLSLSHAWPPCSFLLSFLPRPPVTNPQLSSAFFGRALIAPSSEVSPAQARHIVQPLFQSCSASIILRRVERLALLRH